jgi:ABC-type proline/glycine betaine transport system substrate-binding protein
LPDPATFRGASVLRNRIIGFYASSEEANAHLTAKLWKELQEKCGAVYAELHNMKLDLAEAKPEIMKLVA